MSVVAAVLASTVGCRACQDRPEIEPTIIPAAQYVPLFDAYLDMPTTMDAEWVALADVTGDGIDDQLVAVQRLGTLAVLPGLGDGTFAPARHIEVGPLPICLVVEDFDGDEVLDVVIATSGDGVVSTWLGDGSGGFERSWRRQVFTESRALYEDEKAWFDVDRVYALETLRAADITGDGILDVVAGRAVFPNTMGEARDLGHGVALLHGRGDGSFQSPRYLDTGGYAVGLALVDLDGDGPIDMAVSHRMKGEVATYRNLGDGSLEPWSTVGVGEHPVFLEAGDLDGDGHQDLVVVNRGSEDLEVLIGGGDGTLRSAGTYRAGPLPEAAALADLDADGVLDVAVSNGKSPQVIGLYRGLGQGRLAEVQDLPAGHCANHAAFSDLDGDGDLDMVVANSSSFTTSVYLGEEGTLRQPSVERLSADSLSSAVVDWDQDGRLDVVLLHGAARHLTLVGGFERSESTRQLQLDLPSLPHEIVALPPSAELAPALVTTLPRAGQLAVLTRAPGGEQLTAIVDLPGVEPLALAAGDLDGDGRRELVVFDGASSGMNVLQDRGVHQFVPAYPLSPLPGRASALLLHDLDGDGKDEILASLQGQDRVVAIDGATGELRGSYATGREPVALLLQDLDGDGLADLFTADIRSDSVSVLPGLPGGGFGPPSAWAACRHPTALAAADVDRDGHLDIAACCLTGNAVALLLGDGAGGFSRRQLYGASFESSVVVLEDLDEDQRVDLLTASGSFSFDRTVHPQAPIMKARTLTIGWGR